MSAMVRRRLLANDRVGLPALVWLAIFVVFVAWIAWRLGAFDLWATVPLADGSTIRIPNTFATVDHPFHASRAESLRRSLANGQLLRWVGSHQGGYPVEFYPLGAAWLEVLVWGVVLGSLPIMAIHKLVVIGVFVLPAVGFCALARGDRLSWGVGFLGLAMHVSVRGWWWSGGYMELIEWGLLTNVASAAVLPIVIFALYRYLDRGDRRPAVVAAGVSAFAMYTNVRSIFPLAAIVVGVWLSLVVWTPERRNTISAIARRSGEVVALALLLLAPLAIPLARFSDSYVFVRYSEYDDLSAYWDSTVQAVSSPVLVLGVIGAVIALVVRRDPLARTVVIVLALYVAGTTAAGLSTFDSLVSQLEATRLMPFQRLLVMYLAAYGVYAVADEVVRRLPARYGMGRELAMLVVALAIVSAYILAWIPGVPASGRASTDIVTTADASIHDLQQAIRLADEEAPAGSAILVLGTVLSWHDQLWSPQWSDRRFLYDDWLWYWQTDHVGDYDPLTSHAYDQDATTLTPDYLRQHAIGAVVVTGDAAQPASASPLLTEIRSGKYGTYLVNNPQLVMSTAGSSVAAEAFEDHTIQGTSEGPSSDFLVRHNWYPRWSATVDGETASVEKNNAGYMEITADQPGMDVELEYVVDRWDWLGRVLCATGLLISASWLMGNGRAWPWRPRIHRL